MGGVGRGGGGGGPQFVAPGVGASPQRPGGSGGAPAFIPPNIPGESL